MSDFFSTYLPLLAYVLLGLPVVILLKVVPTYFAYNVKDSKHTLEIFKAVMKKYDSGTKVYPIFRSYVNGEYKGRSFNVDQMYGKYGHFLCISTTPNNIPKPLNFYKLIKKYPIFENDYELRVDNVSKMIPWVYKYQIDENEAKKILDDGIRACEKVEKGEYDIN